MSNRLTTPASLYPCAGDEDCGAGTCSTTCSGGFAIDGYLPRLQANDGIVFSHASCTAAYGTACDALDLDYDLYAGSLQAIPGGFELASAGVLAADPGIDEIDALIDGDLFTGGKVYYLGHQATTVSLPVDDNGVPGTRDIEFPQYTIYRRDFSHAGGVWTSESPAVVEAGAFEVVDWSTTPLPCRLDGDENLSLLEGRRVTNPMQFTLSPDGRYLAYTRIEQEIVCEGTFSLDTPQDIVKLGFPQRGDILLYDLQQLTQVPLLGSGCGLGEVSLMPVFLAGGLQLVFTNRPVAGSTLEESAFANRFYRMNVADAGTCEVTELFGLEDLRAALAEANPNLDPLGATLADSRTFTKPACSLGCALGCSDQCAGLEPSLLWLCVFGPALWLDRIRRRPRGRS